MLADGWYKQTHKDEEVLVGRGHRDEIVYIESGMVLDNYADTELWYRMANGFEYTPIVILPVEEHAALVRDADMWRQRRRADGSKF